MSASYFTNSACFSFFDYSFILAKGMSAKAVPHQGD
jgi:hypothetical protein